MIKRSLIYGQILFKFALNILHVISSSMGYVLFMFTHRAHACERICASERVIKHSLIFGRIFFKFAGHILQMTTSYMSYILIMFTHRAHASERAYASARVVYLWTDSLQICGEHTSNHHK